MSSAKGRRPAGGLSRTAKMSIVALSLAVAGGVTAFGVHVASTHPPRFPGVQSGRYPPAAEAGFLHQCQKTGSATLCGCVLHELEKRYTFEQFRDFVATFTRTQALPAGAVDALAVCTRPTPSTSQT
jgi:hypothetical protein